MATPPSSSPFRRPPLWMVAVFTCLAAALFAASMLLRDDAPDPARIGDGFDREGVVFAVPADEPPGLESAEARVVRGVGVAVFTLRNEPGVAICAGTRDACTARVGGEVLRTDAADPITVVVVPHDGELSRAARVYWSNTRFTTALPAYLR